ncbi:MAG: hypothetical protein GC187_06645 [Alphaproteobacteria bacterium]|nr:hypothetical protein [Alphaproteobacteria bacterium]
MTRQDALELFRGRRLPVVIGAEAAECGLACMTMIARWHGHDVDLYGLRLTPAVPTNSKQTLTSQNQNQCAKKPDWGERDGF